MLTVAFLALCLVWCLLWNVLLSTFPTLLLSDLAEYYQTRQGALVHNAGQTQCGILLQYVMTQPGTMKDSLGVAALRRGVQCVKKRIILFKLVIGKSWDVTFCWNTSPFKARPKYETMKQPEWFYLRLKLTKLQQNFFKGCLLEQLPLNTSREPYFSATGT